MTSNPNPPIFPAGAGDPDRDDPPTQEVDGEEVLDPDADDDAVDSIDADRLASGADGEA